MSPKREIADGATQRLMIRRHRYSDSVKDEVGENWAERRPPEMLPVEASAEELAVAREILTPAGLHSIVIDYLAHGAPRLLAREVVAD